MNKEFYQEIEELTKGNTIESYEKIKELIVEEKTSHKHGISDDELDDLLRDTDIGIIKIQLEELLPNQYKEDINLRGKLISIYKVAQKTTKDEEKKLHYRHEELEELKKQKEVLHVYRNKKDTKIKIPEKLALTIKELSKTIEIFIKDKDVLTKLKNVVKETTHGSASVAALITGIGLILQALTGIPFSLSSLVAASPSVAYIGLSSVIRNASSKTKFQQYEYYQSPEFQKMIKEFGETHKQEYQDIARMTAELQDLTNVVDKIELNEELIKTIDKLSNSTDIDGVKQALEIQALQCFRNIKECRESIKDDYLDEKNDDVEKYKANNKELMRINLEIFKRENSFKQAFKVASKNTINNIKVVLIAKLILSVISPTTFPLNNLQQLAVPVAFALVNGVIDITTFKEKIKYKETQYQSKIKSDNLNRIEKILAMDKDVVFA